MEKIFFYDLETTGVKHWRNGIHQMSGRIVIDGDVKEEFNFKVKPFTSAIIEDEALEIAGVTRGDISNYEEISHVYKKLLLMLGKYVDKYNRSDKFHLCGYNNASFDNSFLRTFFKCNLDDYFGSWFWSDSIDVMVLASNHLRGERSKLPNFKLTTVAKYFGIDVEEDKLHDALYDIHLTQLVYEKIK